MKSSKKLFLTIFIIFLIFLNLFIFSYFFIWIPNQKLLDKAWWEESTPKEKRILAHKILSYPVGNHHDALIILIEHGNDESIPYLSKRR